MELTLREALSGAATDSGCPEMLPYLPELRLDTEQIRVVMLNEIVPEDPAEDFYGGAASPTYLETVFPLFREAGSPLTDTEGLLKKGIYLTNAVKLPKQETTVPPHLMEASLPVLEAELGLFPNLAVVMLMGDVAKKLFNRIAKKKTGKAAIPAGSTYKLRAGEFWCGSVRVFPSYIMTGKNILIEKSKFSMAAEDIRRMLELRK